MNRKFEKVIAYIGASWQIISGLATIFIYALWIKKQGIDIQGDSKLSIMSAQIVIDNLYMFSVTFGFLFVILGIVNFILTKKLKNDESQVKIPVWFIFCGIISYILMDFIGGLAFIGAGVLSLAKNKTIEVLTNKQVT